MTVYLQLKLVICISLCIFTTNIRSVTLISHLNKLAKTVKSLGEHYSSQCVFLLSPLKKRHDSMVIVDLWKQFHKLNFYSPIKILPTAQDIDVAVFRCHRPLCVLPFNHTPDDSLNQVSRIFSSVSNIWLQILEESQSIEEFYQNTDIPVNCEMLVMKIKENVVQLTEVFRKDSHLPLQKITFANWNENGGLSVTKLRLYERRNDLQDVIIKAVLLHDPPYVTIRDDEHALEVGGFVGDIFHTLQQHLNFTTLFIVSTDRVWGQLSFNGSWNGMVGAIQRQEVDMSINAFTFTTQRRTALDYTVPILSKDFHVFIKMPSKTAFSWTRFLQPFSLKLWIVTCLSIVVIGLVIAKFNVMGRNYHHNDKHNRQSPNRYLKIDSIFCIYSVYLQQGQDAVFEFTSCKVILLTALLVSTVIRAAYSGVVISFLAVHTVAMPFSDVTALLADSSYKVGVFGVPAELRNVNASSGKDIMADLLSKIKEDEKNAPKSLLEGLNRVCTSKYALLTAVDAVTSLMDNISCPLVPLPGVSFTSTSALSLVKNSPFRSLFNHVLHKTVHGGILKKLHKDILGRELTKPLYIEMEAHLEDVTPILALVLFGVVFGCAILMMELRMYRTRNVVP